MKYELIDGFYIRKLDPKNWIVGKTMIGGEKAKIPGEEYEKIISYHSSVQEAWRSACDDIPSACESNDELKDIVERLERLKFSV